MCVGVSMCACLCGEGRRGEEGEGREREGRLWGLFERPVGPSVVGKNITIPSLIGPSLSVLQGPPPPARRSAPTSISPLASPSAPPSARSVPLLHVLHDATSCLHLNPRGAAVHSTLLLGGDLPSCREVLFFPCFFQVGLPYSGCRISPPFPSPFGSGSASLLGEERPQPQEERKMRRGSAARLE